ncbi:transcription factor CP2-like protein 1 isoform X2 [Palaemon carinicauda]
MFRLSKADFKEICGIPAGLVMFEALRRPQSCVLRLYIKPENTNCYTAMFLQRFSYDDFVLKLSDILKCNPASIKQITMEHSTGIHILVTNEVIANMEDESIFTIKIERETSSSTNEQFDAAHSDHHISEEDSEEDSEDLHRANERQQPTKLIVKLKSQVEDCPENRSCI